jgi:transposase
MRTQWSELGRRIEEFNKEFVAFVKTDEGARFLVSNSGVGVTIASALIAAIGKVESFAKGRDLAAWLGRFPKQSTTGGRTRLSGISKHGNKYLRTLLIHGARSALPSIARSDSPLGRWAKGLFARAHENIAVVALANKLARIAWTVLQRRVKFALSVSWVLRCPSLA